MLKIKLSIMVLMLLAVGLPLVADDKPEDEINDNTSEEQTAESVEQLTGQFAEMATAGKVNEKQAKAILTIQTAMDKALAKWDETSEKKIAAYETRISKTKNAKRKARIEKDLEKFKASRDRIEARHHSKALTVLTPSQRGEYLGPKLWSAISQKFNAVNLDEEQEAKALKICKKLSMTAKTDPTTNQSLKSRASKNIATNVLTKEQKKQLCKSQGKAPVKTVPSKKRRTRRSNR